MTQALKSETPLSFVFENEEGKPAIHILGGHKNELGLRLTHKIDQPVKLRGGQPVEESQLTENGPSSLYVHFNRMLSTEDVGQLRVSTSEEFCFVRDSFLQLKPETDLDPAAGWTLTFKVIISDMESHVYSSTRPNSLPEPILSFAFADHPAVFLFLHALAVEDCLRPPWPQRSEEEEERLERLADERAVAVLPWLDFNPDSQDPIADNYYQEDLPTSRSVLLQNTFLKLVPGRLREGKLEVGIVLTFEPGDGDGVLESFVTCARQISENVTILAAHRDCDRGAGGEVSSRHAPPESSKQIEIRSLDWSTALRKEYKLNDRDLRFQLRDFELWNVYLSLYFDENASRKVEELKSKWFDEFWENFTKEFDRKDEHGFVWAHLWSKLEHSIRAYALEGLSGLSGLSVSDTRLAQQLEENWGAFLEEARSRARSEVLTNELREEVEGTFRELMTSFFWEVSFPFWEVISPQARANLIGMKPAAGRNHFQVSRPVCGGLRIVQHKGRTRKIAADWFYKTFDGKYGTYLAMTPKEDIELPSEFLFMLHNVGAEPLAHTNYVTIDYRNIEGIPDGAMQSKLFVLRLPDNKLLDAAQRRIDDATRSLHELIGHDAGDINKQIGELSEALKAVTQSEHDTLAMLKEGRRLPITCGFRGTNQVYVGQANTNNLILFISNQSNNKAIKGAKNADPGFTISFVCDNNPNHAGAIAPSKDASGIHFELHELYGDKWTLEHHLETAWQCKLKPLNPDVVLSAPPEGTVEVLITNIPVLKEGITPLHVEYKGMSTYTDGNFSIPVLKVNPVVIEEFEIRDLSKLPEVTLRYKVSHASSVTCSPKGETRDFSKRPANVPHEGEFKIQIDQTTTFQLTARHTDPEQEVSKFLTVEYSQPPLGTIMMWSGDPKELPSGWDLCDGQSFRVRRENNEYWKRHYEKIHFTDPNPDGFVHYRKPQLSGRFVLGHNPNAGGKQYKQEGNLGGHETHTLDITEIPVHKHHVYDKGHTHQTRVLLNPSSTDEDDNSLPVYRSDSNAFETNTGKADIKMDNEILDTSDKKVRAGMPHNNMPPYYVLAYIIRTS